MLKTLLEKLEAIRKQLSSDKVIDVIGCLLQDVSIKDYLEQSLADGRSEAAGTRLEGTPTEGQVQGNPRSGTGPIRAGRRCQTFAEAAQRRGRTEGLPKAAARLCLGTLVIERGTCIRAGLNMPFGPKTGTRC